MILTTRVQHALDLAATLHRDHTRVGEQNTPYITHLVAVASIVHQYGGDEDTVIAALLHDTVEDIDTHTVQHLRDEFGDTIANIVDSLTEPEEYKKNLSHEDAWVKSKKAYLQQLKDSVNAAKLISAADKLNNMDSMVRQFINGDKMIQERLTNRAIIGQVWFCSQVAEIVKPSIPEELYNKFTKTLEDLKELQSANL